MSSSITEEDLLLWKMQYGDEFKLVRWTTQKGRKANKGIEIQFKSDSKVPYRFRYLYGVEAKKYSRDYCKTKEEFLKELNITIERMNKAWPLLSEEEWRIDTPELICGVKYR